VRNTTFALIGSGIVGERIINQLRNNESATIVALFDENDKRLNEMANTYGLYAASSIEEVLELKPKTRLDLYWNSICCTLYGSGCK
jgi:predicted dehydrogenase